MQQRWQSTVRSEEFGAGIRRLLRHEELLQKSEAVAVAAASGARGEEEHGATDAEEAASQQLLARRLGALQRVSIRFVSQLHTRFLLLPSRRDVTANPLGSLAVTHFRYACCCTAAAHALGRN